MGLLNPFVSNGTDLSASGLAAIEQR